MLLKSPVAGILLPFTHSFVGYSWLVKANSHISLLEQPLYELAVFHACDKTCRLLDYHCTVVGEAESSRLVEGTESSGNEWPPLHVSPCMVLYERRNACSINAQKTLLAKWIWQMTACTTIFHKAGEGTRKQVILAASGLYNNHKPNRLSKDSKLSI